MILSWDDIEKQCYDPDDNFNLKSMKIESEACQIKVCGQ